MASVKVCVQCERSICDYLNILCLSAVICCVCVRVCMHYEGVVIIGLVCVIVFQRDA